MSLSPPLLLPLTGSIDIVVTSTGQGSWVKGVYQKGTPNERTISANVQPVLKGTDTLLVPEADRSKEIIKIYTTEKLVSRIEGSNPNDADTIVYDGKTFEVMRVISYKIGILNHYKAIAVRKELT